MVNKRIALTVVLCLIFAGLVVAGFVNRLTKPRMLTDYEMREYGAMLHKTPRQFSDFELLDQHGKPFTHDDLEGKWSLVFFGFTHCPDICPTTMAFLNKVVSAMEEDEREEIQVIMLSVDPERDTVEALSRYVPYFNKDFIGLTGNPYQVLNLATQLGVAYTKVPQGEDYTVDHSGNIVIINPRGHYHGFFRPPFEEGSVRVALRSMMFQFDE